MTVRAKFSVSYHRTVRNGSDYPPYTEIVMNAIYNNDTPENQGFTKATPSGQLVMQCDVPEVLAAMKSGKTFYLDFTPAN